MDDCSRFHLSLTTDDIGRQRAFYTEVLGCNVARTGPDFEDFDFFGHQLTFHVRPQALALPYETFHFGAIVTCQEFDRICAQLSTASVSFVIAPTVQAAGTPDERHKTVFLDPSGYAVELKCYSDRSRALISAPAYARVPAGS